MNSLLVVCGLTESNCGESMLGKVTSLFGGGSETTKDVDSDIEDGQHDRSTPVTETNSETEDMNVSTHKDAALHVSPKATPTGIHGMLNSPVSPKSPADTRGIIKDEDPAMQESKKIAQKTEKEAGTPKSTGYVSPFGSEKSVEKEEQEDVDTMLANLEIPDFDMSLSIEDQEVEDVPSGQRPWETVDWKERIGREEVYSKRYKPKATEVKELEAMAASLGIAKSTAFFRTIGIASKETQNIQRLLSGDHSILLSVLPVICGETKYDLLLLTDGFILKNRAVSYFNPLEKRYETCQQWKDVDFIERVNQFEIVIQIVDSPKKYRLSPMDELTSLDTIYERLEHAIIFHELFDSTSHRTDTLGWQYLRVRKPAFTAAVTNDPKVLDGKHQTVTRCINEIDDYNKHAPLHYAVLHDECNLDVIRGLLNAGAAPNLEDGDGRSAMYYAERHGLPREIINALASAGGTKSKLAETELRGELFSRVEGANLNSEQRRERERLAKEHEQVMKDQKAAEAQYKAEAAQSEMSKAMTALVERGEKIEMLDHKTRDLEAEAKTFGDLAARLKDEVKGKKWYQL